MDKAAFEKMREIAERGDDQNAQYELGRLYVDGPGFPDRFFSQDIHRGLEFIGRAAALGHVGAKAYLYDNEQRLRRRLKKRHRAEILPLCVLLGFVALLVFLGSMTAMQSGWKHGLELSVVTLVSATSCFWLVLVSVLIQKLRGAGRWVATQKFADPARREQSRASLFVFIFGCVFVAALVVLAIVFPSPTVFQYTIFRIVLALASSGIAAFVPGLLRVRLNNWLAASGALAVFVIVYFFSPAALAAGSLGADTGNIHPAVLGR